MDHLQYKRAWLAAGALMLSVVFLMSISSKPAMFEAIMKADKLAHALGYAVLMALFAQMFRHVLTRLLLVLALFLFGLVMELVQSGIPERHFDYMDLAANTAGIVCSWALVHTCPGNMFVKVETLCSRLRLA